ncbi:hypothetical protein [Reinekea sp.]|uniref:hypothetical protein n=1 Tax=Reinekea sp. TaxID=1970455 RepID=UPI003988CBA3
MYNWILQKVGFTMMHQGSQLDLTTFNNQLACITNDCLDATSTFTNYLKVVFTYGSVT